MNQWSCWLPGWIGKWFVQWVLGEWSTNIIVHGFDHADTLRLIDDDDLPEYVTSDDDDDGSDESDNDIDPLVGNKESVSDVYKIFNHVLYGVLKVTI